ncbi:DUF5990 family protein [Frankia sp. AgKG'84/4]|uniref:DUF5990 family protein n=1 Tax=Frankia sp. AgKG'84/4 TaxID=573490 RepID=UPI00200D6220|nr:DUF5990 family protein [Frankia sp. AgKG'84/4]MCL9796263.1 DUF5990 family protein [Frankia sp. AgKG'84/4]
MTPNGCGAADGGARRLEIRIEAVDLPGRDWGARGEALCRRNVHVAVQRRDRPQELLDPHRADAPSAVWTLPATATHTLAGLDITGAYVQGRPGGRFIYLTWGAVDDAGAFAMFRRAKLMLDAVDPAVLDAAGRSGRLTGRLGLTDARGGPLCAAVRPPLVAWSAAQG